MIRNLKYFGKNFASKHNFRCQLNTVACFKRSSDGFQKDAFEVESLHVSEQLYSVNNYLFTYRASECFFLKC